MRFALDTDGNRVCVDDANKRNKYTCPCCGEELTVRQGRLIGWCFAHKSGSLFFFLPFLAPPLALVCPNSTDYLRLHPCSGCLMRHRKRIIKIPLCQPFPQGGNPFSSAHVSFSAFLPCVFLVPLLSVCKRTF